MRDAADFAPTTAKRANSKLQRNADSNSDSDSEPRSGEPN